MCVIAGAGTGKTRAITHRIAYAVLAGFVSARHVSALTFTARAAGEMRHRLRTLGVPGVQARTFHAAALKQLHHFWPRVVGGAAPEIVSHKAALVAEAAARLRLDVDRATVRDLASEIEWAKVSMVVAADYASAAARARRAEPGLDRAAVARLFDVYEDLKTARGVIDFEDVLLLTVGMLRDRPDVLAQVRDLYRYFVVDEYQDVSAVQHRLLDLWRGERDDLCVVGDIAQTIYSFTGASPRFLTGFAAAHPQAQIVRLDTNYRSTPQIVHLADTVLQGRRSADWVGMTVRLRSVAPAGPAPDLRCYPDDAAEAAGVAARIRAHIDAGRAPSQIAVLFRTNAQSEAVERALDDVEVPFQVRGGTRFFARPEVRSALVLLRGAARSDDGATALGALTRDVLTSAGWSADPPQSGARRETWESLQALVRLADDLQAADEDARLTHLVDDLSERAAHAHAPTMEGVTLASLHAAKGLEWDVVFFIGCSDGLLPISAAEGIDAVDEELRLMYVGMTRARCLLHLTWSASRGGGRSTRRPSRFLNAAAALLGGADAGLERSAKSTASRPRRQREQAARHCSGCGATLETAPTRKTGRCVDCPPAYDPEVFESLREWRRETAGRESLPAYCVFTDATLAAIAERMPPDEGALARISGVGVRKLDRYGRQVLEVMSRHR